MHISTARAAARVAGAGHPSQATYTTPSRVAATQARSRRTRQVRRITSIHPTISPTWNPEIERRCTRPLAAKRSRSGRSRAPWRSKWSASMSGAWAPYRWRVTRKSSARSRSARGVGTPSAGAPTSCTTSAPPGRANGPEGRGYHFPFTRTARPTSTAAPSGQRTSVAPPHPAPTTSASTLPSCTGGGSIGISISSTAPRRSTDRQVDASPSHAMTAEKRPIARAPRRSGANGLFRTNHPRPTSANITGHGSRKRERPVARPAPKAMTSSTTGGGLTAPSGTRSLRQGARGGTAARRRGNLPEPLHQDHVDVRPPLAELELDLGDHPAPLGGHVLGGEAVQCEDLDVVSAEGAAAELREAGPEVLVVLRHMLVDDVADHRTARAGISDRSSPVKVEPVVPERRTR